MRYLIILTLVFLTNFSFASQVENETVEVSVNLTGNDEAKLKKTAFDNALRQATLQILQKYTSNPQKHKVEEVIAEQNLRKFFTKADVINSDITQENETTKRFEGTFRFVFAIDDVKRFLLNNQLEFAEVLATTYKILQMPIFLENNRIYHWFDSTIANSFLINTKQINNFNIHLVEPNISVVKIDIINKFRMHKLAKNLQELYQYDGYNLIICDVEASSNSLSCENHLIYDDKKMLSQIDLTNNELDDGAQLVDEINSIYINTYVADNKIIIEKPKTNNNELHVVLQYNELAELLRFQELLTQNPYVSNYKVKESGFGSTSFLIQLRGNFDNFSSYLNENKVEVINYSQESNTYFLKYQ